MDNGLIFPYPPFRAKTKLTDTNLTNLVVVPSGIICWGCGGPWVGAVSDGVTQEGSSAQAVVVLG